jgi:AraC-like DNA-binding protein
MTYILQKIFHNVEIELFKNSRTPLDQLSQKLGVGRHTIERATLKIAGLSFRNYRQHIILTKALTLIDADNLHSRKEIAFVLGFQSVDAFARFIRRSTGLCFTDLVHRLAKNIYFH